MELSRQSGLRRSCLHARWIPRLQNEEAHALTSSSFEHFDAAKRIPLKLVDLKFRVLHEWLRTARSTSSSSKLKQAEREKRRQKMSATAAKKLLTLRDTRRGQTRGCGREARSEMKRQSARQTCRCGLTDMENVSR